MLLLSIPVGAEGRVLSFEVNPGHLEIARRNVERWSKSWNLSQQSKWPDNVSFHCTPIQDAQSCLEVPLVDGVSRVLCVVYLFFPPPSFVCIMCPSCVCVV